MIIKPSTSLRNQYNEISNLCKTTDEPIYLTKNGEGDLVIMSIEAFERREEALKIKEAILEARLARLNEEKTYSIDELDHALKEITDK